MPGSSLFTLLDDISTILDDVAAMTKVATKKTAGVLGDDLALNAQQVAGVKADRELPVVWAVAKGSVVNKAILVPAALAIAALLPVAITPLLMLGGLFLCYEGVEKLAHKWLHADEDAAHEAELQKALLDPSVDFVKLEQDKVKGAVRTDFILSAEIIVISLGTVAEQTLAMQLAVLVGISAIMTVGVYGLVAGIVKLDDFGAYLSRREGGGSKRMGAFILRAAPLLMKFLSFAGTAAMFLVGGGIVVHGIPALDAVSVGLGSGTGALALFGPSLIGFVVGIVAGAVVLALVTAVQKLLARRKAAA
jgi:hypothetical protein